MDISCTCNSCGSKFKVPAQYQGRKAKCSKCGAALTVPKIAVAINPADKSSPGPARQPPALPRQTTGGNGVAKWILAGAGGTSLLLVVAIGVLWGVGKPAPARLSSATAPAASSAPPAPVHAVAEVSPAQKPVAATPAGTPAASAGQAAQAKPEGPQNAPTTAGASTPPPSAKAGGQPQAAPVPTPKSKGKGAHNSKPGKGKGGRDGSGQAFADWIQDFATAQAKAAAENKDILLLFDGSDWCEGSIRLTHEVFSQKEFHAQADAKYVLVLIDFPKKGAAKKRVHNTRRNEQLAKRFGVSGFPTIFLADGYGRVYGTFGYQEGGVSAFLEKMKAAAAVRDQLHELLVPIDHSAPKENLEAIGAAVKFLEDKNLVRYNTALLHDWLGIARRQDGQNEAGVYEKVFADAWLVQLTAVNPPTAGSIRPLVQALDAWKAECHFKDPDRAAMLHLYAGVAMLVIHEIESGARYFDAALKFHPQDAKLVSRLKSLQLAVRGNMGSGTGFVVAADGYLLTNRHVVEGAKRLFVQLPNQKDPLPATVAAKDDEGDMALLKIDLPPATRLRPLTIATTSLGRGTRIGAFGYPLGGEVGTGLKLTTGIASAPADQTPEGMILLDCRVNPGNSGGPLCDTHGRVVGMVTAKSLNSLKVDSYGMALPGQMLCDFLQKHLPTAPRRTASATAAISREWDDIDRQVSPSVLLVLRSGEPAVIGQHGSPSSGGAPTPAPPAHPERPADSAGAAAAKSGGAGADAAADDLRARQLAKNRQRTLLDAQRYSEQERREMLALYEETKQKSQIAQAREALAKLQQRYKTANLTGCAVLNLAMKSRGAPRYAYLKQAIADYGDCYFGDGVQVGAWARFMLGHDYLTEGHADKAKALFNEIRADYPDAIDHLGKPLLPQLPQ